MKTAWHPLQVQRCPPQNPAADHTADIEHYAAMRGPLWAFRLAMMDIEFQSGKKAREIIIGAATDLNWSFKNCPAPCSRSFASCIRVFLALLDRLSRQKIPSPMPVGRPHRTLLINVHNLYQWKVLGCELDVHACWIVDRFQPAHREDA